MIRSKWVERGSFLRLSVFAPLMISRMTVRVNQYTDKGRLMRIKETFDVLPSSSKQSFFVPLVEGWIESVSIGDAEYVVQRGRVFVQISIQSDDDDSVGSLPHTILAADYFVSSVGMQWPGTPIRQFREGPGFLGSANIGNPAAGANFTNTIDAGVVRRIMAVAFRLVTDATVATRTPGLEVVVGGIVAVSPLPGATQAASQTKDFSFSDVGQGLVSTPVLSNCFPSDLYLKGGDVLRSQVVGIQAGDQLSNIVMVYEEWVEER